MLLRDKNGRTEEEYLAACAAKPYPKPSVTADIAVIASDGPKREILLVKRGGHPFLGHWALPGGFANPNEPLEKTASRELEEETGVANLPFEPVGIFSEPGRDPRGWVISQAYVSVLDSRPACAAGDDAADTAWFAVGVSKTGDALTVCLTSEKERTRIQAKRVPPPYAGGVKTALSVTDDGGLAFDHALIILRALTVVKIL